jgi:Fic family protein
MSKIDHLSKMPLQPTTSFKLHQTYLAKGAAATTAIEGNSLSEAEVLEAVQGKLKVPPSKEYLKQEVENVLEVFNQIINQIATGALPPLTSSLICDYDRQILQNLTLEEGVVPGVFRTHSVTVGNVYLGAPAEDCEFLMNELFQWLNGPTFIPPQDAKGIELTVAYGIIKAIVAHLYLAWIHPFGDGNGRTARLAEFYILMSAGVPAPASHLLSNHYNQTRAEYYRQLVYASKSGGDIVPFIEYAVRGFQDGLRDQLQSVWDQTWKITWENYVHELFPFDSSPTDARRHILTLELGTRNDWVDIGAIRTLTPSLTKAYTKKGQKTVQRDINKLAELKIIDREARRIRAKRELIFGFCAVRKTEPLAPVIPIESSSAQMPLPLQLPTAPSG